MNINAYPLIRGLASYVFPLSIFKKPGSGGTYSSEYCYSVWMRHLYYLRKNGLITSPYHLQKVAEIGPGDSLGIGMCSIYTGVKKYYAFDVIKHANFTINSAINNELNQYFQSAMDVPNGASLKEVHPKIDDLSFPNDFLTCDKVHYGKIYNHIKNALKGSNESDISIDYIVHSDNEFDHDDFQFDLIYSQAVMEHIIDIEKAYNNMYKWLRKGGIISHEIDFATHEMTPEWDGHWYINEKIWKIIAHGRKYPMNRLPLSSHIRAIKNAGFSIKFVLPNKETIRSSDRMPSVKNANFSDEDLWTSSAFIQAQKL